MPPQLFIQAAANNPMAVITRLIGDMMPRITPMMDRTILMIAAAANAFPIAVMALMIDSELILIFSVILSKILFILKPQVVSRIIRSPISTDTGLVNVPLRIPVTFPKAVITALV